MRNRPLDSIVASVRHLRRSLSNASGVQPHEWALLLKMSAMLASLLVLQRTVSLPRLMQIFDTKPATTARGGIDPKRLVYLVTGLVRATLYDRYCMKRSILIFHFLRKWGYDVRILFGVARDGGQLKGHAWVDLNGDPLAERGDPHQTYVITYAYPAQSEASAPAA